MTSLVWIALAIRRGVRSFFGLFTVLVLALLDILGVFRVRIEELGIEHYLVGAGFSLVLLARVTARIRRKSESSDLSFLELEIGLLLLAALHALLQLVGGLSSPLYPSVYVLVAFVCSLLRRKAGLMFVASAIGFEALLHFLAEARTDVESFSVHAWFLAVFGLLSLAVTQTEVIRMRYRSQRELDEEKRRLRDDARLFRLVGAPTDSIARDEDKVFRSSVEQVHQALFFNLDLLKRTQDLYSCILLVQDDRGDTLRLVEVATDSDEIADGPFDVGGGAVGGAVSRGLTVNLEHIRPGYRGICYYEGPAPVRAFLAVPLEENGRTCGVLCADRIQDRPFTARDEEVFRNAVAHIQRTLENERVFVQLERSKREQTILHRASRALGAALNEDAVLDAGLEAAAEISQYDFAAITEYDPESNRHSVRRAVGEGADEFANLSFRDNMSLTSMAVKNRHYLPYRGEFDSGQQVLYTRKANLEGMESLLILPLNVRDSAIGTLALAARRPNAYTSSVRPALQVLANQLAVALSNAALVARLEQQATTDGLTGCRNKRAFENELESKLRAAQRFRRRLSLVITDIDHFKSVNDTHGHAVGDVVLKELGRILRCMKRETDIVARFGGEEFCLLCEETDTRGAVQLAERVREEFANTVFQTEMGRLQVTCSSGVATFPDNARDRVALFEIADKAMYAAKQRGRNQVCTLGALG